MTASKPLLLLVALLSAALLGAALYLQVALKMLPCPLCVLQRYAFALLALTCLFGALAPHRARGIFTGLGIFTALTGAGIAGWHLWIKAHPSVSCGIDPLETSLNTVPSARLFPLLFQADGLCTTDYAPILGLSIPQWSMVWFLAFAVLLTTAAIRRRHALR